MIRGRGPTRVFFGVPDARMRRLASLASCIRDSILIGKQLSKLLPPSSTNQTISADGVPQLAQTSTGQSRGVRKYVHAKKRTPTTAAKLQIKKKKKPFGVKSN